MTLSEIEMIRLLPEFMRSDAANKGLSAASDAQISAVANAAGLLSIWDRLSELPETFLDLLAWQLDITWYDSTAPREVREKIIRDSDRMHMILGSRAAVEQILSDYFGKVEMREWFEYGGAHDHFKLIVPGVATIENYEGFMRLLNAVKRLSSVFDGFLVGLRDAAGFFAGGAIHYTAHETWKMAEVTE